MIKLRDNYWAVDVPDGLVSPYFNIEQTISAIVLDEEEYELVISHVER